MNVAETTAHQSFAITHEGRLFGWGHSNALGLHNIYTNSNILIPTHLAPTTAIGNLRFKDVVGTSGATLALSTDGRLFTWGGFNEVLGQGSSGVNGLIPTHVAPNATIRDLRFSSISKLSAITTDGRLFTWGWNNVNQTGTGLPTNNPVLIPTHVSPTAAIGNLRWSSVSGRMGLTTDDRLFGWGRCSNGSLGLGTVGFMEVAHPRHIAPTVEIGNLRWSYLSNSHWGNADGGLGITTDGRLFSWGGNFHGKTGHGTSAGYTRVPTHVAPTSEIGNLRWSRVSSSLTHSLGITTDGRLFSWGQGVAAGQNTTNDILVPTHVAPTPEIGNLRWEHIATNTFGTSFAITTCGRTFAWGESHDGRTGLNRTGNVYIPTLMAELRHTVTFDTNGGEPTPQTQTVLHGEFAIEPVTMTRADHTFVHWALSNDLETPFDFASTPITSNITLVAVWEEIEQVLGLAELIVHIFYNNIDLDSFGGDAVRYQAFRDQLFLAKNALLDIADLNAGQLAFRARLLRESLPD